VSIIYDLHSTLTIPGLLDNGGFNVTMNSPTNAATITLTQIDGASAPTVRQPVKVCFRASTLSIAAPTYLTVPNTLSLVVPSGATLGSVNTYAQRYWIYLVNNAGTVALGICGVKLDDTILQTSTAISSGSSSIGTLYTTAALTNVPILCIGYFISTQATAGTWVTSPSTCFIGVDNLPKEVIYAEYNTAAGQTIPAGSAGPNVGGGTIVNYGTRVIDTHNAVTVGASWIFTAPIAKYYHIDCMAQTDSIEPASNYYGINFYKNNAFYRSLYAIYLTANGVNPSWQGSTGLNLNAGEYISICAYAGSACHLYANVYDNWITISSLN